MSPQPPSTPKKPRSIFAGLPTPPSTPLTSPSSSFTSSVGKNATPVTPIKTRSSGPTRRGVSAWSTPKRQTRVLKPKTPRFAPPVPRLLCQELQKLEEKKSPAKTLPSTRDNEVQLSRRAIFSRVHHDGWPPAADLVPVAAKRDRKRKLEAGKEKRDWRRSLGRACVGLDAAEAVAPLLELAGAPDKIRNEAV